MLFGKYLPGVFGNAGYSLERVVSDIWLSTVGVMGTAFGVLLNLVLVFIVFGAVLSNTGAGESLIKIAFALTGRMRGGPAHGAVIASMAFGTMSGSTVANVVGTGSFTIPLIKRRGFTPRFSGAVEAAASTGGQFTPPVMGSAAFLLADLADIPYILVALGALVPALYYYVSIFLAVELESARRGIQPTPEAERTGLSRRDWLNGLMFVGPIVVIVTLMVAGRSPAFAGFSAIIATIVFAFALNPEFRKNLKSLGPALAEGGTNATQILIIIACIGIFIGVIDATGIGVKLAQFISSTSKEDLFLSLVVTAIAATFLSMGMPTTPAYLIRRAHHGTGHRQAGCADFRHAHVHSVLRGSGRGDAAGGRRLLHRRPHRRGRPAEAQLHRRPPDLGGLYHALRLHLRPLDPSDYRGVHLEADWRRSASGSRSPCICVPWASRDTPGTR